MEKRRHWCPTNGNVEMELTSKCLHSVWTSTLKWLITNEVISFLDTSHLASFFMRTHNLETVFYKFRWAIKTLIFLVFYKKLTFDSNSGPNSVIIGSSHIALSCWILCFSFVSLVRNMTAEVTNSFSRKLWILRMYHAHNGNNFPLCWLQGESRYVGSAGGRPDP